MNLIFNMKDNIVENAKKYIENLFSNNSDGHDLAHTLRVYELAKTIAREYSQCKSIIVELASLLHDADDYKLFNTENNANARRFLEEQDVSEETIDEICSVINSVSFSKNKGKTPDTLEGKIVQDADRLDALGAIGIARTFTYGGAHNRSIEDSVKHFYEKLLLLKDTMNTESGKRIAENRHCFLEKFIEEYKKEMNSET